MQASFFHVPFENIFKLQTGTSHVATRPAFRDKTLFNFNKSVFERHLPISNVHGSTFGSSTKTSLGINWDNSVMVGYVVRTVQCLETALERMDQNLANPDMYMYNSVHRSCFCCLTGKNE